jgi:hypothetical protein
LSSDDIYLLRITRKKREITLLPLHDEVRVNTIHICGPKTTYS